MLTSSPGENAEPDACAFNPKDLDHLAFFVESVRGLQIATSSSIEALRNQKERTPLAECWEDRQRFPHGTIRRWDGMSFDAWRASTGQDVRSRLEAQPWPSGTFGNKPEPCP